MPMSRSTRWDLLTMTTIHLRNGMILQVEIITQTQATLLILLSTQSLPCQVQCHAPHRCRCTYCAGAGEDDSIRTTEIQLCYSKLPLETLQICVVGWDLNLQKQTEQDEKHMILWDRARWETHDFVRPSKMRNTWFCERDVQKFEKQLYIAHFDVI